MKYWWVNHKQTVKTEVEEGYIWSPAQNNNGSRNQTYLNLKEALPGDLVFSYANGRIGAVGIVSHNAVMSQRPVSFGTVGNQWAPTGWLLEIRWTILTPPLVPKDYIENIAPLLPKKHSPIQSNGNGNQGCYLAGISDELGEYLLSQINNSNVYLSSGLQDNETFVQEDLEEQNIKNKPLTATHRTQLIEARVGQGIFRQAVERKESCCRLTGLTNKALLIASHIKPWRVSSDNEKLDGNNGLLLSPHVDKLFDKGYISFDDTGRIIIAHSSIADVMRSWNLDAKKDVGLFSKQQKIYLQYHRDVIFEAKAKALQIKSPAWQK